MIKVTRFLQEKPNLVKVKLNKARLRGEKNGICGAVGEFPNFGPGVTMKEGRKIAVTHRDERYSGWLSIADARSKGTCKK